MILPLRDRGLQRAARAQVQQITVTIAPMGSNAKTCSDPFMIAEVGQTQLRQCAPQAVRDPRGRPLIGSGDDNGEAIAVDFGEAIFAAEAGAHDSCDMAAHLFAHIGVPHAAQASQLVNPAVQHCVRRVPHSVATGSKMNRLAQRSGLHQAVERIAAPIKLACPAKAASPSSQRATHGT